MLEGNDGKEAPSAGMAAVSALVFKRSTKTGVNPDAVHVFFFSFVSFFFRFFFNNKNLILFYTVMAGEVFLVGQVLWIALK